MQIITTVNNTYLALDANVIENRVELKHALSINIKSTNESIARSYILGTLTDKVIDINLNMQNVESVQDANEITPLVELMMRYVPIAEKNAKAGMIISELTKLMSSIEAKKPSNE